MKKFQNIEGNIDNMQVNSMMPGKFHDAKYPVGLVMV
jgi:hypothetical protein